MGYFDSTASAGFGAIRRLPSKRFQTSYTGPDMGRHVAPGTFPTSLDAEAWLAIERRLVDTNMRTPPAVRDQIEVVERDEALFATYAQTWLTERDLKPRTHAHYASLLEMNRPGFRGGSVSWFWLLLGSGFQRSA